MVRDVFQLKFGMAKDAIAPMKAIAPVMKADMTTPVNVCVDVTGHSNRMVLDTQFPSLAAYEVETSIGMSDPAWQQWYADFKPLCESSFRGIWKTVDL